MSAELTAPGRTPEPDLAEQRLAEIRGSLKRMERIPPTGFRADTIWLLARLTALEAENAKIRAERRRLCHLVMTKFGAEFGSVVIASVPEHTIELVIEEGRERREALSGLRKALARWVRIDIGYCTACHGHWLHGQRGEHLADCPAHLLAAPESLGEHPREVTPT